jgi:hypothetical protein
MAKVAKEQAPIKPSVRDSQPAANLGDSVALF